MPSVISLFDDSGNLMAPWLEAGFDVWVVDILNPVAGEHAGRLHRVHADLTKPFLSPVPREDIRFVSAHPPCDHLAVSGARWFKGKGLRALAHSIEMFATAAEFADWSGAPFMIENPVSTISTYWRKSDHGYQPYEYSGFDPRDSYTKHTRLWTGGGFVMPPPNIHPMVEAAIDVVVKACGRMVVKRKALEKLGRNQLVEDWYPDDRIHACPPGEMRAYVRSVTPAGFGRAVFESNCPLW